MECFDSGNEFNSADHVEIEGDGIKKDSHYKGNQKILSSYLHFPHKNYVPQYPIINGAGMSNMSNYYQPMQYYYPQGIIVCIMYIYIYIFFSLGNILNSF